jgi:hypothetical protein
VEVTPDGVTWLVRVSCGERIIFDATTTSCVNPDEFVNGLYVFMRGCLKAAQAPKARPEEKPS